VVSGGISEIDRTAVVLPTPNPPAMTNFTGSGGWGPRPGDSDDALESTDHPFDGGEIIA